MLWVVGSTGQGILGGRSRLLIALQRECTPSYCPRNRVMILELKQVIVSTFKHPEGVTQVWPAESTGKAIEVGEQPSEGS